MASSNEIGRPASKVVRPNQDIPRGVPVQRQESGGINSKNEAGGEVDRDQYSQQSK
jgi:hypothetical protein